MTAEEPLSCSGRFAGTPAGAALLDVRALTVHFPAADGVVQAVNEVSFSLEQGRTLAIVGESGSGKTVTGLSILGLHNRRRTAIRGEIWLDGQDLLKASAREVRSLRGRKMAMVFQDPLTALNPFHTVGWQIAEGYRLHNAVSRHQAWAQTVDILDRVGIPEPHRRAHDYPHQFSGGMRQRTMIAMALVCRPKLLIADEPTTALDVTVQAQILDLIGDLQQEYGSAVILITHDLGIVAEIADEVAVMYAGRIVEQGPTDSVFRTPEHPYTWGLLRSLARLDRPRQARLTPIAGTPPSLVAMPPGCALHPRCSYAEDECVRTRPALREVRQGHVAACHLPDDVRGGIAETEVAPFR